MDRESEITELSVKEPRMGKNFKYEARLQKFEYFDSILPNRDTNAVSDEV